MDKIKWHNTLESITTTYQKLNQTLLTQKDTVLCSNKNLLSLKETFYLNYKTIIDELTFIIDKISDSSNEQSEKEKDTEESPASIIRSLNLNWISDSSTDGNLVTSNKGSSYWCVESEQVLEGPFISKVEIEQFTRNQYYWNHMFGIIRNNKISFDMGSYYNNAILISSNGWLADKYSGSGAHKKLWDQERHWKQGDILIVKRDNNNTIWFGINDESNLFEAFDNIDGEYRICMGFISTAGNEKFRMVYLNLA